ncbi:hypothetical protein IAD21_02294 [Abditibacteriota bacterium]|nr:hypothetical protein IAD21_02294 [Abditibacteriota bacterium]
MDLPPLPLSPLDDGKPPQRVPRAIARVEIHGQNWIVRPCNGLLFARREDQNVQEWTFAAMKPLPAAETNQQRLGELWSQALQAHKIARMATFESRYVYREFPLFFAEDGTGWMREFWNRDDFPFQWNTQGRSGHVLTRPIEEMQALCHSIFDKFVFPPLNDWNETHPDEDPYRDEELHFICGSQQELERLCRLICWSNDLMALSQTPLRVDIRSESGGNRAELESLSFEDIYFDQMHPRDRKDSNLPGWYENQTPATGGRLFEMAIEENTPVGFYWEYNDQGSGRASHSPESFTLSFSFSPPSQHEHLEAKLEMRDWLKARVSLGEVEQLLGR